MTSYKFLHYTYDQYLKKSRQSDNEINGQSRDYYMRNTFLEKTYTKCGGEASPRPFSKKSKLKTSLDQQSEMLYLFFLYAQFEF